MKDHNQDQDAQQRAKELQMDACLTELGGVGPDRSLASRILDEVAERDRNGRVIAARATAPRWLIAAFVIVGLSVVGGIAYMRTNPEDNVDKGTANGGIEAPSDPSDQGPTGQDPKAVTTLICDYTDDCILEVDSEGKTVNRWPEMFGIWDASLLPNGNLLLVEWSTSRVSEQTRSGKVVWQFEDLKNPYSAQRLRNGNTLIADTFAERVIEVNPAGKIVWTFDKGIRPYDAEMTDAGTVLIADVIGDRVIEVDSSGTIVWQIKDVKTPHDADRLPNGNTLVTIRDEGGDKVVEFNREGVAVWTLDGLKRCGPPAKRQYAHRRERTCTRVQQGQAGRRGNQGGLCRRGQSRHGSLAEPGAPATARTREAKAPAQTPTQTPAQADLHVDC